MDKYLKGDHQDMPAIKEFLYKNSGRHMMNKKIFIIGGSPCSGKSTIAERISKEYGIFYFKVDDFLEEFISIASKNGCQTCKKSIEMTADEIWMREPFIQCEEEFHIYDEISQFVFKHIEGINADFIVTEGAAYTPKVISNHTLNEYITIIPTPDFQISHYKEREWVPYILEGCSDKLQAFDNWMNRDILFAKQVKEECAANGIPCIVNDGLSSIDELFDKVKRLFKLPNVLSKTCQNSSL